MWVLVESVSKAFRPVIQRVVARFNINHDENHSNYQRKIGPNHELEEETVVFLGDAIVREDAMMVHVVNAPVAAATVIDSNVGSIHAALTTRRNFLVVALN